ETLRRRGSHALAELVLLDLPGRRLRQLAELDLARSLEARQVQARERDQLGLREGRVRPERDEGLRTLAPFLARDRDHRRLEDVRMADERLLHLDRRDVLAAGDDDVLGPVAQLDVA